MSDAGATASRTRDRSIARRIGYGLLPGEGFSYILHLRPREWPIMTAHTLLGVALAQGVAATLTGTRLNIIALVIVSWVVCLNGGTLALNSAFDRDEGDIGYLDAPPPPPRGLAAFGMLLMVAGGVIALVLPAGYRFAYATCFVLSVLYSVPPVRLKAVAGADWLINMLGFGTLTPYAGWAATGMPVPAWGLWILVGFCPLFAALYPLTQLYQIEEDRRRGDRTLAIIVGLERSLAISLVMTAIAFACFARGAQLAGAGWIGWAGLVIAATAWMGVLVPWYRMAARLAPSQHQRLMYAALGAWAVTDVAILAVAV